MKDAKTLAQLLWLPLKPLFPIFSRLVVRAGLITPPTIGRHRFPLGFLKPSFSAKEFRLLLKQRGFSVQPMAFDDPGQILSVRKLDPKHPHFQYHIRLYRDGEVRGHYEKTPEDHPLDHLREVGFEARRDELLSLLAGLIDETVLVALRDLAIPEKRDRPAFLPYRAAAPRAERDADR